MKTDVRVVCLLTSVLTVWCTEGGDNSSHEHSSPLLTSPPLQGITTTLHNTHTLRVEETAVTSSLTLFILHNTQRRDIIIIHDSTSPNAGLAGVVESCFRSLVDTTLLSYYPLLNLEAIVAPQKVVSKSSVRVVVVLCSPNNTRHIFEEVRERSLESRSVRWVVVTEEHHLLHSLSDVIREGTHVGLVLRVSANLYHLFTSNVQPNNKIIFREVGRWRHDGGGGRKGESGKGRISTRVIEERSQVETDERTRTATITTTIETEGGTEEGYHYFLKKKTKGSASSTFLPDPTTLTTSYRNFEGRELTVSVVSNFPFFLLLQRLPPLPPLPDRGIDYNIISSLAQYLNFT
ncbi:hypothetical protein Pcinc_029880 [Petrolisthes cinctipes]|uniref:Receptor ligand binding region domain-containing protein n=1 Tax=Petrolisthes cinctipes TaxID=88211 RepID=A0AAE1EZH1_PETCI|nr:hypothetical protein Pcinc_029880 [Petrolisthes cinctipes]